MYWKTKLIAGCYNIWSPSIVLDRSFLLDFSAMLPLIKVPLVVYFSDVRHSFTVLNRCEQLICTIFSNRTIPSTTNPDSSWTRSLEHDEIWIAVHARNSIRPIFSACILQFVELPSPPQDTSVHPNKMCNRLTIGQHAILVLGSLIILSAVLIPDDVAALPFLPGSGNGVCWFEYSGLLFEDVTITNTFYSPVYFSHSASDRFRAEACVHSFQFRITLRIAWQHNILVFRT